MRTHTLKGGRSDPELASQEVSEVLAGVRGRFSDDDDDGMEPVSGPSGDTATLQDSLLEPEQSDRDSARYGREEDDADEEDEFARAGFARP